MRHPGDLQGNILRGYRGHHHAAYVFARMGEPPAARRLLGRVLPRIGTERDWESEREPRLNIAFTHAGLEHLGVDGEPFAQFADFREGMHVRARPQLRDLGANDPDGWEPELREGAHVLFTVYGADCQARDHEAARLEAELREAGMGVLYVQRADTLEGLREHFGFRDGYSQPAIEGISEDRRSRRGEGVRRPAWQLGLAPWRGFRLGEFVHGHRDEDGDVAGGEHRLLRNGTFMVWRKLEQHVDAFEDWIRAHAGDDPAAADELKAKIVGRWPRTGASLVTHPAHDGAAAAAGREGAGPPRPQINEFVYGSDRGGLACPLGAHVRRANPRDGLGFGTRRSVRNRIIRRGMPYTDSEAARGLIFVCFNASISRQFEQIQGNWLMDGDTFGLGPHSDFLIGGTSDDGRGVRMTIQGDRSRPPRFLERDRQWVTVRGGYYLWVPGMAALRSLSATVR